MLQEKQSHSSSIGAQGFILIQYLVAEGATEPEDVNAPLDDAARTERDYVRQRLREELQREPTEQEVDEWLRQHTEGY
ncbi:MAG: hypothetical protein QOC96_884 [Acidobacteriota bacterium]|nr:hypothetical protein [Acidobacteriota bacterium]